MTINNPTKYTLNKVHRFDILNKELNQRVLVDVLEPIGASENLFIAVPYLMGYKCDESVAGCGESVEAALNDCLEKISKMSWEEFMKRTNPSED